MQNISPQICNGFWAEALNFFSIVLVPTIDNFLAQFVFHFAVFRKKIVVQILYFFNSILGVFDIPHYGVLDLFKFHSSW